MAKKIKPAKRRKKKPNPSRSTKRSQKPLLPTTPSRKRRSRKTTKGTTRKPLTQGSNTPTRSRVREGKGPSLDVIANLRLATPAPTKPCLPLPAAITLVRSCSGTSDDLPLSTQLGQLFPAPTKRNSFCQCVADGVPTNRSEIPCGSTNTLQDVVDEIVC
jgi:hypothetical protein